MNKLAIITTPYFFADETSLAELLFAEEMSRLHLRKPGCKRDELEGLLNKIFPAYYDRIILHDWFTLAEERVLGGIHLNERNLEAPPSHKGSISRSCHGLEEVIEYKPVCDYVFLSPISQGISKERYDNGFSLDGLRNAKGITNDRVSVSGGICPRVTTKLKDILFGGVAILGAPWRNGPSLLVTDQLMRRSKRLQIWP